MSSASGSGLGATASIEAPSMLDLVRLSPRRLFPPGGIELYRHIARLADLSPGDELLVVGSGNGVTLEYFVEEHGVHGSGVDHDPGMVQGAEARARATDRAGALQFQHAPLDRLPYRDEIFDVAVGELALSAAGSEPGEAIRELARVTRPGGTVVLIQPVWKAPVDDDRRELLSRHLGVRPLMLVEWKRLLREAGVEQLHTEDWSDPETAFRARGVKPFPDFAELFGLWEKIGILRRAWSRWGLVGVRNVLLREREVHRLLTRERILGLDLVKGTRVVEGAATDPELEAEAGGAGADAAAEAGRAPEDRASTSDAVSPGDGGAAGEEPAPGSDDREDLEGLPLFTPEGQNP